MRTPRFNDYRGITAEHAGKSNACGSKVGGHDIAVGDLIGYVPKRRYGGPPAPTMCSACWSSWCCENAEAQAYEDKCDSMGMELGREGGELW